MDILFLLVPIALVFVAIAIRFFLWAVRSGQYDDLEMEGRRILFEEESRKTLSDVRQSGENPDEIARTIKSAPQDPLDGQSGSQ